MMTGMILVFLAFMLAGWIQGLIGFGFAIATTLLLLNQMDFTQLVYFNLCQSVLTSVMAMLSAKNLRSINRNTLFKLIVSSAIGLVLGLVMIRYVNAVILKQVTLTVILMASLLSLTKKKLIFAHSSMAWTGGFFSGLLTPSTGINGPFVALHLNAAFTNKESMRSTMLAYLFLIMSFGALSMTLQVDFDPGTKELLLKLTVPSIVGYVFGMLSFRLLPNKVYQQAVTFFLIASSVLSLIYLIQ